MTALQRTLTDRLNDQQTQVAGPCGLGAKVDQSADELRAVRENLAALSSRLANLDNKLSDISSAVRTLSQPRPRLRRPHQCGPPPPVATGPAAPPGSPQKPLV